MKIFVIFYHMMALFGEVEIPAWNKLELAREDQSKSLWNCSLKRDDHE